MDFPGEGGSDRDALGSEDGEELLPGQLLGRGILLQGWREAVSLRRGKLLTQKAVASALDRCPRWYRDLEGGAPTRLSRQMCDVLADVLELSRDERRALMLYGMGGGVPSAAIRRNGVDSDLQLLVDQQLPSPAYLVNATWDIVAYNETCARWWPWATVPDANVMRWILLSSDARQQIHDWDYHAAEYVSVLKFGAVRHPANTVLSQLISDVLADPIVRRMWDTSGKLSDHLDGATYRMTLPSLSQRTVEFRGHVLYPAGAPDCRLVVATEARGGEHDSPHSEPRRLGALRPGSDG
jgi:hypothetical protein